MSSGIEELRRGFDHLEVQLRSLEALGESTENQLMVSLLQSKLSKEVMDSLIMLKRADDIWTVSLLRDTLRRYISNKEYSVHVTEDIDAGPLCGSAEALVARESPKGQAKKTEPKSGWQKKQPAVVQRTKKCVYCA